MKKLVLFSILLGSTPILFGMETPAIQKKKIISLFDLITQPTFIDPTFDTICNHLTTIPLPEYHQKLTFTHDDKEHTFADTVTVACEKNPTKYLSEKLFWALKKKDIIMLRKYLSIDYSYFHPVIRQLCARKISIPTK
ncbi:MAG: hypothetical protein WD068_01090 [Candidatus Babeliales bacterium]